MNRPGYKLFMTSKDDSATHIRAYPNGPILVRGDFLLLDEDGEPIPASRRTVALCRCGRTGIPPFCDGTHTLPRHTS
jgi:hypothetical protein